MPTKRARVITEDVMRSVIAFQVDRSAHPVRDRVLLCLSFYAGLRACEISRIKTNAFLNAQGQLDDFLQIFGDVGKKRGQRIIPIHPELGDALVAFLERYPELDYVALYSRSSDRRRGHMTAGTLARWFWRVFEAYGLQGCSSHSGRRSFITLLAQRANLFHGSLRDVQLLAGHARLDTTERYIEPSDNQAQLVASLGKRESVEAKIEAANDHAIPSRGFRPAWTQSIHTSQIATIRPSKLDRFAQMRAEAEEYKFYTHDLRGQGGRR
jgi:integrase